jgi:hypothetical protein
MSATEPIATALWEGVIRFDRRAPVEGFDSPDRIMGMVADQVNQARHLGFVGPVRIKRNENPDGECYEWRIKIAR